MWQPPPPPRPPFAYPPPPPPPPPPRKNPAAHQQAPSTCSTQPEQSGTCNSSRRVSSHDGSEMSALAPSGPSSNPDPSSYQHESIVQSSGLTGEVADVLHRLESKLIFEISRVELEAQAAHRALAADVGKWRKEREAAWKHVGELKEQSRLLRQRNYELEVQNGHLHRHIMLLQEQMAAVAEQRGQFEAAVRMAAAGQAVQAAQAQGAAALAAAAAAAGLQGPGVAVGASQMDQVTASSLLQHLTLSGLPPHGSSHEAGGHGGPGSARGDPTAGLPASLLGHPGARPGSTGSTGNGPAAGMPPSVGGSLGGLSLASSGRGFPDNFPDSILGGLGGGQGLLGAGRANAGPGGPAAGVIGEKKLMPRLPHSGADIW